MNNQSEKNLKHLNKHFQYEADAKYWDAGNFMSPDTVPIKGDCEDYSFYVARYVLGDGSLNQFYKSLWQRNFEFWYVKTRTKGTRSGGGSHCILVDTKTTKCIDNWTKRFVSRDEMEELHDFQFRLATPIVVWMLFAGVVEKLVKKFKK
jgi:hypothetical protein